MEILRGCQPFYLVTVRGIKDNIIIYISLPSVFALKVIGGV